jgi:hypothetical protein
MNLIIKRSIKDLRKNIYPYHVLEFEDEEIGLQYNSRYSFATWLHVLKNGESTLCAVFDKCGIQFHIFENKETGLLFACFLENHKPLCFPSPYNGDLEVNQFYREVVVTLFAFY